MIVWLAAVALADPGALRGPADPVVLDLGTPESSAAAWLPGGLGLAVEVRADGGAVGVSAGARRRLVGTGPAGVWGVLAGGVVVPTVAPTLALSVSPAIVAGHDGDRLYATIGLAAPIVAAPTGARIPVLAEGGLAARIGPADGPAVRLGARLGLGARFTPGYAPATLGQASLVVSVPVGRRPGG